MSVCNPATVLAVSGKIPGAAVGSDQPSIHIKRHCVTLPLATAFTVTTPETVLLSPGKPMPTVGGAPPQSTTFVDHAAGMIASGVVGYGGHLCDPAAALVVSQINMRSADAVAPKAFHPRRIRLFHGDVVTGGGGHRGYRIRSRC